MEVLQLFLLCARIRRRVPYNDPITRPFCEELSVNRGEKICVSSNVLVDLVDVLPDLREWRRVSDGKSKFRGHESRSISTPTFSLSTRLFFLIPAPKASLKHFLAFSVLSFHQPFQTQRKWRNEESIETKAAVKVKEGLQLSRIFRSQDHWIHFYLPTQTSLVRKTDFFFCIVTNLQAARNI